MLIKIKSSHRSKKQLHLLLMICFKANNLYLLFKNFLKYFNNYKTSITLFFQLFII